MKEEDFFNKTKHPFSLVIKLTQEKSKNKKIFCFFEGKDNFYYYPIIKDAINGKYEIKNYITNGKIGVLNTYKIIKDQKINTRNLFFIDKDFDDNSKIDKNDIYVTKGYSIENYYTTQEVFKEICKNNFYCSRKKIINNYLKRKLEYHKLIEILNQLYKYSKINSMGFYLKKININSLIDISYSKVKYKKEIKDIEDFLISKVDLLKSEYFKDIYKISFGTKNLDFRGKYELDFFIEFLNLTKKYIEDNNLKEGKLKIRGLDKGDNFLDNFSKYAYIPSNLNKYIKSKI